MHRFVYVSKTSEARVTNGVWKFVRFRDFFRRKTLTTIEEISQNSRFEDVHLFYLKNTSVTARRVGKEIMFFTKKEIHSTIVERYSSLNILSLFNGKF